MLIGVINNKSRSTKVYGQIVPFTLEKGKTVVDVRIETEKKKLYVLGPNNPNGDLFIDLPSNGLFVPAIMNKSAKTDRNLKIMA